MGRVKATEASVSRPIQLTCIPAIVENTDLSLVPATRAMSVSVPPIVHTFLTAAERDERGEWRAAGRRQATGRDSAGRRRSRKNFDPSREIPQKRTVQFGRRRRGRRGAVRREPVDPACYPPSTRASSKNSRRDRCLNRRQGTWSRFVPPPPYSRENLAGKPKPRRVKLRHDSSFPSTCNHNFRKDHHNSMLFCVSRHRRYRGTRIYWCFCDEIKSCEEISVFPNNVRRVGLGEVSP